MPNSAADQQRVQEGAAFSVGSYNTTVTLPPGNWSVERINANSGYQAAIYIDRDAKQVFVANTGTNDLSDVKSWPDALFGARSQQFKDMLLTGNEIKARTGTGGDLEGYTVQTTGHSWGELMAQLMTFVFGWQGTGFDGPGAKLVIDDSRFTQTLQQLNMTAVQGTDFISCDTAGLNIPGLPPL